MMLHNCHCDIVMGGVVLKMKLSILKGMIFQNILLPTITYVTRFAKIDHLAQIANVQYTPGNMTMLFFGEDHFLLPSDYTSNSLSFETKIASYFVVVSEIATHLRLGARVHGNRVSS